MKVFVDYTGQRTVDALKKAYKELETAHNLEYPNDDLCIKTVRIQLAEETEINLSTYAKTKHITADHLDAKTFMNEAGHPCYNTTKRGGFALIRIPKIVSLEVLEQKPEPTPLEKQEKIVKLIHPHLWNNLVEQHTNGEEWAVEKCYKTANLKSAFGREGKWVVDQLKDAIENKKDFHYDMPGKKRDKRVDVKVCDDGQLQAWYASELAGCGNGDYYIIINPTTALFTERD